MNEAEVRERAFAMPLTSPAFPRGPYRFLQRRAGQLQASGGCVSDR